MHVKSITYDFGFGPSVCFYQDEIESTFKDIHDSSLAQEYSIHTPNTIDNTSVLLLQTIDEAGNSTREGKFSSESVSIKIYRPQHIRQAHETALAYFKTITQSWDKLLCLPKLDITFTNASLSKAIERGWLPTYLKAAQTYEASSIFYLFSPSIPNRLGKIKCLISAQRNQDSAQNELTCSIFSTYSAEPYKIGGEDRTVTFLSKKSLFELLTTQLEHLVHSCVGEELE